MIRISRARDWVAERPFAGDALVALGAVALGIVPVVFGSEDRQLGLQFSAWSVPLAVLASAPLILRRRYPLAVWVASLGIGLVALLVDRGPSPAYVPAIIALYTVATVSRLRVTIGAAVVTAVAPGAVLGLLAGANVVESLAYGLTAWSLLAAASGFAVRSQQTVIAEAHERARQAEFTREEEAQRRVAQERLRIARELHDVVAHHVSVINVQAGVAGHLIRTDPDKTAEALAHVREASQVVLREVPELLGLLRSDDELERAPVPRLADADDLIEAARRSGLEVTWRKKGSPRLLGPGADLAVYRVLQEALTNAARHGSGQATVALAYEPTNVTLEVRNERRRESAGADTAGERHGLDGMRERAATVGGDLTVGPERGRDWVVRLQLPTQREVCVESP